jgi:hypothetical protein
MRLMDADSAKMKKNLRSLKKLEYKIRFTSSFDQETMTKEYQRQKFVWDDFFDLKNNKESKAKYSLQQLSCLCKDEFKAIVDEFFFNVYYRYYVENGFLNFGMYDPRILKWMGLSADAGFEDIRKKFRELAKKHHPDKGGDPERFIELMDNYNRLI